MPICFVVMGYGEKTDFATGRKLNLDKTYNNIVKPAVEAAGYECVRADEIRHSGIIDIPMYDMLLDAELVVADLSTSNPNALFELGVRHALRPRSTVVIAESGFANPFDVNHLVIRRYTHLGIDIGYEEVLRMRKELRDLLASTAQSDRADSPVYSLLQNLEAPRRTKGVSTLGKATEFDTVNSAESYAAHWKDAMMAKDRGDFKRAREILRTIYQAQAKSTTSDEVKTPDTRIVQELALATYMAGEKNANAKPQAAEDAYAEAIALLQQLEPEKTLDPETLGLWSAVHKRRSGLRGRSEAQRRSDLDTAIFSTERGFLIRLDHYNGGNLAFLLDLRASMSEGDEQVADRVLANRVRQRLLQITEARLEVLTKAVGEAPEAASEDLKDEAFWVRATHAEVLIGLGAAEADNNIDDLRNHTQKDWMLTTALDQIAKLRKVHAEFKETKS